MKSLIASPRIAAQRFFAPPSATAHHPRSVSSFLAITCYVSLFAAAATAFPAHVFSFLAAATPPLLFLIMPTERPQNGAPAEQEHPQNGCARRADLQTFREQCWACPQNLSESKNAALSAFACIQPMVHA